MTFSPTLSGAENTAGPPRAWSVVWRGLVSQGNADVPSSRVVPSRGSPRFLGEGEGLTAEAAPQVPRWPGRCAVPAALCAPPGSALDELSLAVESAGEWRGRPPR